MHNIPTDMLKHIDEQNRLRGCERKKKVSYKGFIGLVLVIIVLGLMLLSKDCESASRDYNSAVIHHTASHDVGVKEIDKWHKERGWDGIGYHWVIRASGIVEEGRKMFKKGAHKKGHNHKTGIALTGYGTFTKAQKNSLKELLVKLGVKNIERHHEDCPSDGINVDGINGGLR